MQFRGTLRKLALSALVVGAGAGLSGCVVNGGGYADDGYYDDSRSYPPAHPRNGYRYAYPSGPSLIFDSGLGMYAVYGYRDYYYHDGYFYRWNSAGWNRSRQWNRHWERCDSRHWPRPIYHANHNYYGRGKRPNYDWDRKDNHGKGNHDGRNDHDGRGDHDGRPGEHHGGRPAPGGGHGGSGNGHDGGPPSGGGHGGSPNGGGNGGNHRDPGDVDGDGKRERGERYMRGGSNGERKSEDQRRREIEQDLRDHSRERDPVDHRRQPDTEEPRRDQDMRATRDAAIRQQASDRHAAERAMAEQRTRERGDRQAAEQSERGQRQAAEQAERAQRRDAERQRDEARREESRGDDDEAERSQRGGERGDNWQDGRGERR